MSALREMLLAAAVAVLAGCGGGQGSGDHDHHGAHDAGAADASAAADRWLCPMHPTYVADRPGDCPICGMDLVPAREFAAQQGGGASGVPGMAALELSDDAIRLAGVRTRPAAIETLTTEIRAVGLVTADQTRVSSVQTRVAGWIESLAVSAVGESVRRGEPLLSLYSPELLATQEELLRARAAGDELLAEAARRRLELFGAPREFVARIEASGAAQRAVPLPAPVTGVITARLAYEGMQVAPGMALFEVADLSEVWIEARFYEYEASLVVAGAPVEVRLPHDPSVVLQGTLDHVYPTLDEASRTLAARVVLPNDFGLLRPGMYADVRLVVDRGAALVIPDDAILDTGERRIVFVHLGEGRFTPREVRVGVRSGGRAQILAGLAAGEDVVVRANFLLDSESRIRAALLGQGGEVPAGGHAEGAP